jgi:SHS2 domain-containing protein
VRSHRFAEHGGEVELELRADTEAEVFEAALDALAELVAPEGRGGEEAVRELELEAPDRARLLADWLEELVVLAEVEELVTRLELADGRLRATVAGRRGRVRPLVKAVTLHRLELSEEEDGWHGRAVLDV